MRTGNWLALAALVTGAMGVTAAEMIGLRGTDTKFATQIDTTLDGKNIPMSLTGVALRTRFIVNVYAMGSYVQAGTTVKTPEELASADVPKQLRIVMERDVTGSDMAEAFRSAIRANYPEPNFNAELADLVEKMKVLNLKKGDTVALSHVPNTGLVAVISGGKGEFVIKNPKFSKAVWDIYLGRRNLGDDIKENLTNRL